MLKVIWRVSWKIYVGLIFAFTAILLYPFFYILLSKDHWKKSSFKLFVFWSWLMRIFCFYPVKKMKMSPIPEGPYIIVANHTSYLDIFLMCSILPHHPFVFMGKSEILRYPILKTYFKKLHIPVFRNDRLKAAKSFIHAKKAVAHGWSLVIFPEGGIPDDHKPRMIPFKEGAFKLAKNLKIPIVPVTFTRNHLLFSDPDDLYGPAHPGISHVYIHPHISIEQIELLTQDELMNLCHSVVNQPLLDEYPHLYDSFDPSVN